MENHDEAAGEEANHGGGDYRNTCGKFGSPAVTCAELNSHSHPLDQNKQIPRHIKRHFKNDQLYGE